MPLPRSAVLHPYAQARWLAWLTLFVLACTPRSHDEATLRFAVDQGEVHNEFFRQGAAAAHLVLTSGRSPRLLVAFPAGNSGAALWLEAASGLRWPSALTMRAAHLEQGGHRWHGVSTELAVRAPRLRIRQALLGSVRAIRAFEQTRSVPPGLSTLAQVSGPEVTWRRARLDGGAGYILSVRVLGGGHVRLHASNSSEVLLTPSAQGPLRLRVTALTGDRPLTPLRPERLLDARAAPDSRLRHVLEFLSYEEKLLAGSWRFNTYFGRDTLMTLLLLGPVARPPLLEAGLGAVFERLSANGEVAHEEEVGEYALAERMRAGLGARAEPLLDYKMVDDDFMLAPAFATYQQRTPESAVRAFLARRAPSGLRYGALLVRNLGFVVSRARAFASEPDFRQLVSLKPGERTGNWRDSEDGLGGGRYPYDVNAVLVPAALAAIARLVRSSVLQQYLDEAARTALADAAALAEIWSRRAPPLFERKVPAADARAAVARYAASLGLSAEPALAALDADPLRFMAVALDERGVPIPIMNSDPSFALLLQTLRTDEVERIARTLTRPFPAGLMTEVGLLVANPAYAPPEMAQQFDRNRYHGTVVWAWQQGLLAAGVERQLARTDLTSSARARLTEARGVLRAARAETAAERGAELWSWSIENGRYRVAPFGQRAAHETESNAAQLWSTIELAR